MKRKTTEQLTEDLEKLLNRIYQSVDMEVARTIVETALDKTEKRRIEAVGNSKAFKILQMAKGLKSIGEIIEETQYAEASIYQIMRKEGIYSRKRVKQMLRQGKTPEEIAKEGNVNVDAVEKLSEELLKIEEQRKRTKKEKKESPVISEVVRLTKNLDSIDEIASKVPYTKANIYYIMRKRGIYSREKVEKLIKEGKTPEEIAQEGNVNIDAVVRFKSEIEETREDAKADDIIEAAKSLTRVKKITEKFQVTQSHVRNITDKEGIYSRRKVKQLIEEGKTLEEIAREGNVYLEAVIKFKKEIENKRHKKTNEEEKASNVSRIIELAKSLKNINKISKEAQYSKRYIYQIMRQEGIYTVGKVKQLIEEGKTPEEIAQEGNVNLDAVIKLREELEKSGKGKIEKGKTPKVEKIIELAKDLKSVTEIAKEVQSIRSYVYQIIGREGIYSKSKVEQLIEEGKTPEEIAKEGNVNLDAVIRFINEPSHSKKRKTKIKDSDVSRIVEMARNLKSKDEIMRTLQISISYVNQIMRQEGIYSRKKVGQLIIEGKTDKQIATEGNVNLEAVKELREEIVAHTKPQETMETQPKKVLPRRRTIPQTDQPTSIKYQSQSRQSTSQESQDIGKSETDKKILSLARKLVSVEAIVSALGIPEYTIRNKLIKNNILPRERIISLINQGEKTDAEIAAESGCNVQAIETLRNEISNLRQIVNRNSKYKMAIEMLEKGESASKISVTLKLKMQHIRQLEELLVTKKEETTDSKRKGIEFNIEITKLRASINTMQHSSRVQAESTDYKIQRILYKYPELLGRREYAFFAYAYSKVGEYLKAIELGEEYLELDTPSISALQKKIKEVLEEEKSKQTENQSEVALSGANLGEAETGATRTVKIGQTVGDSEGDEHSGR